MRFSIQTKLLLAFASVCTIIALLGVHSNFLINELTKTSTKVEKEDAPLIESMVKVNYLATNAHLFLEEILSGDTDGNVHQVWDELNHALWYCDAILKGGTNEKGIYIPTNDPVVRMKMEETRKDLVKFIALAKKRHEYYSESLSSGSVIDQEFGTLYKMIQQGLANISMQYPQKSTQTNHTKYLLADAHLFLEEYLEGGKHVDIRSVTGQFAKVETFILSFQETMPISLKQNMKKLLQMLHQRIETKSSYFGAGSIMVAKFDALFKRFIKSANEAQEAVRNNMNKGLLSIRENSQESHFLSIVATVLGTLLSLVIGILLAKHISVPLVRLSRTQKKVNEGDLSEDPILGRTDEIGDLSASFTNLMRTMRNTALLADKVAGGDYSTDINPRSSKDRLGQALLNMTSKLREITAINKKQLFLMESQTTLNDTARGELNLQTLAKNICSFFAKHINAQIASFYIVENEEEILKLHGSYAFHLRKDIAGSIQFGEGLVGQAAFEKELISITNIPEDYIRINSSLGDSIPKNIVLAPFLYEGKTKGVIELGACELFSEEQIQLIQNVMESIAVAVHSAQIHIKMDALLDEAQIKAEELQAQQEELQATNEELQTSEESLQAQQEELETINEELSSRSEELEKQQQTILKKNSDLEETQTLLEDNALKLSKSNRYKSDFLANMSHELRSPLNSLLILADQLTRNKAGNLTTDQVEYSKIIFNSGKDLLALINDILDLSRIEAGKMETHLSPVAISKIEENILSAFTHLAREKGLDFSVRIHANLGKTLISDSRRLHQILRNLISNAIKFTKQGGVTVNFHPVEKGTTFSDADLVAEKSIGISITDTGIGIPLENQRDIFDAFLQIDGSISREFDGTGLGLSISRELAKILGGEIHVKSTYGEGSTFTLYLPLQSEKVLSSTIEHETPLGLKTGIDSHQKITDEAHEQHDPTGNEEKKLPEDASVVLLIEEDERLASILEKYCEDRNFRCLQTSDDNKGFKLAELYHPDAIILDMKASNKKHSNILTALQENAQKTGTPVQLIEGESCQMESLLHETSLLLNKANKRVHEVGNKTPKFSIDNEEIFKGKKILMVDDDMRNLYAVSSVLEGEGVTVLEAGSGATALNILAQEDKINLVLMDIMMPKMDGNETIKQIRKSLKYANVPIIALTAKAMPGDRKICLDAGANDYLAKPIVDMNRLLSLLRIWLQ